MPVVRRSHCMHPDHAHLVVCGVREDEPVQRDSRVQIFASLWQHAPDCRVSVALELKLGETLADTIVPV